MASADIKLIYFFYVCIDEEDFTKDDVIRIIGGLLIVMYGRRRRRRSRYPLRRTRGSYKRFKYQRDMMKSLIGAIEHKTLEIEPSITSTTGLATGLTVNYLLPNITQDTHGENTRVGLKITAKKIDLKILIKNNRGTPEDCLMRIIIFRYKGSADPNHNATPGTILVAPTDIMSYRASLAKNQERVVVYYDKVFKLSVAADGHAQKYIELGWKLNHHILFNDDAAGDEDDCKQNGWYIGHFCNAALDANAPSMTVLGRMRFIDL